MKNVEIVLKSCPFCGGKAELDVWGDCDRGKVKCTECYASTNIDWALNTVDLWNCRVEEGEVVKMKVEVKDEVERKSKEEMKRMIKGGESNQKRFVRVEGDRCWCWVNGMECDEVGMNCCKCNVADGRYD